jgi:hypothetical protein
MDKNWLDPEIEILSPVAWFTRVHLHDGGFNNKSGFWRPKVCSGLLVRAPPSAAAEVALKELRKSLFERQ